MVDWNTMESGFLLLSDGNNTSSGEKEDKLYTTGFAVTAGLVLLVIVGVVGTILWQNPSKPGVASTNPEKNSQQIPSSKNAVVKSAITQVPSATPSAKIEPTPTPTSTPSPTPSPTPHSDPTATPTPTPTPTPSPTITPTYTPTSTPTPGPSPT